MQKRSIVSSFIWRITERAGAQIVSFLVSVILARLLAPELYGTVALATVLINIMQVFVDGGLGSALVQKKHADDLDYSSVFYFNVLVCAGLYAVMYLTAPLIADFYGISELTSVVRVLSLTLVFYGIKNIQQSYVYRKMKFKLFFYASVSGMMGSGIIGIFMAMKGFGVWALVFQHLSSTLIDTVVLWITVKWRPKYLFSWKRLKEMLTFSWKIVAASLLDNLYNNLQQMIIGKLYSTEELAHFSKGKQFPFLIINNINVAIDSVMLPSMSKEQDDFNRIHAMLRRGMKTGTYIVMPLLIGLAVVAEPVVCLVLTEKWIGAVPFLQIYCMILVFFPIQTTTMNGLKAIGRSDVFLRIELVKKIVGMMLLLLMMKHGVQAIAVAMMLTAIFGFMLNASVNKKMFGYRFKEQFSDFMPNSLLTLLMVTSIGWISSMDWGAAATLVCQVVLGGASYILMSLISKNESFVYIYRAVFEKK